MKEIFRGKPRKSACLKSHFTLEWATWKASIFYKRSQGLTKTLAISVRPLRQQKCKGVCPSMSGASIFAAESIRRWQTSMLSSLTCPSIQMMCNGVASFCGIRKRRNSKKRKSISVPVITFLLFFCVSLCISISYYVSRLTCFWKVPKALL